MKRARGKRIIRVVVPRVGYNRHPPRRRARRPGGRDRPLGARGVGFVSRVFAVIAALAKHENRARRALVRVSAPGPRGQNTYLALLNRELFRRDVRDSGVLLHRAGDLPASLRVRHDGAARVSARAGERRGPQHDRPAAAHGVASGDARCGILLPHATVRRVRLRATAQQDGRRHGVCWACVRENCVMVIVSV